MHFFAPAYYMRLLENIYSTETSPTTVATIMDVGRKIGKVSVLVKSCQGFLANRMRGPFSVEVCYNWYHIFHSLNKFFQTFESYILKIINSYKYTFISCA